MENEKLGDKVPREARDLFNHFLVVGLGTQDRNDPDTVTILYLDKEAKVSASDCLTAMKYGGRNAFDSRYYDQHLQVGFYVVYGQPVDILSLKVKKTKALDEMYDKYMGMFHLERNGCNIILRHLGQALLSMANINQRGEG
jgi:hypothetical protein